MSTRGITFVVGAAAGAFLAAGLIPLSTAASARADGDDSSPAVDTDFISATDKLLGLFGVNDVGVADPGDNFEAMVVNIPSLGITDVLTSGTDPSDAVGFGATGVGVAGETVNTFIDPSDPALDPLFSFTIPFTDPLAPLWDFLVANDFFGL